MVTRAFAAEDGNLNAKALVTSRNKVYKDIDLTFSVKPSGDVYKKTDAAAVKQAVKNLLLTNHSEKPFQPTFGGNLNALLFELVDAGSANEIRGAVIQAITRSEKRARVLDVNVNLRPESNSIGVQITFQVVNTEEVVTLQTTITRLR